MAFESIKVHPPSQQRSCSFNPLPTTIKTPSGLAMIELQGTIAHTDELHAALQDNSNSTSSLPVGHITFPNYNPEFQEEGSTAWMKKVHMFVGGHQRLTGEVKKLPQPVAIVRKRQAEGEEPKEKDILDIVEIVKYKIVFPSRPEPVSSAT